MVQRTDLNSTVTLGLLEEAKATETKPKEKTHKV